MMRVCQRLWRHLWELENLKRLIISPAVYPRFLEIAELARSLCYSPATYFTRTWLSYVRVSSVAIPSGVCLSSETLVRPTQGLKLLAIIFHRCVRWLSSDLRAKFYRDRHRETPCRELLNEEWCQKHDFAPIEGYIS